MLKGNLVYGQSGGPSCVINASAYGVIKEALDNTDIIENIYIMKNGISGLFNEQFFYTEDYIDQLELLPRTPASAFGSIRYKLSSFKDDVKDFERMVEVFKKYNIKYFIYNGGNDSMDTCVKLSEYVNYIGYDMRIIGVPKTVDNDLVLTDHTPGFGCAAKYIINSIMQLSLDSTVYTKGKVTIVEIMGRHAGWLTAASHVANVHDLGPDLVYLPEVPFDMNSFLTDVKNIYKEKQNCLIAVSEGIKDINHNFIGSLDSPKDAFGHNQLGGVALYLSEVIQNTIGLTCRAIELSSTQRSAAFIRSKTDVLEAIEVGRKAVQYSIEGETGKMITINRISNKPYTVEYGVRDVADIANKEQVIPKSMIDLKNNKMTDEFFEYISPLIVGEFTQDYKNGIQDFFKLNK